jgi:hypothetical protein
MHFVESVTCPEIDLFPLRIVQESRTIHEMRASSSVYDVEKYNCS